MATEIEIKIPEKKFKSFNETFPHCAFGLAIALIYPNPATVKQKLALFGVVTAINSLILFWFLLYLVKCMYTLDMYNLSNNLTIGVLASLFFFKSFYANWKNDKFAQLLEKITEDLLKGNDMDEDYQAIYEYYIKLGKLGQTCWIIIPILLSSQFPIYAGACMIYESLKSDVGKKYMIHEMELKFIENKQYDSPYFELVFAYNLVQCVVLSPNFTGFDGSFCIATNHLRLKLKLLAHKLYKACRTSNSTKELEIRVKETVRDHQEALVFYNDLQEVYGGWLFTVFLFSWLLISLNIYQIYLSQRIHPKYTIFAISGIIHMFAPCYYASNLMKTSEELSWDLYSAPWELWADPAVTKLLIFMIAKSQQTLILTGKGLVYFNMQLFISVLQTSYSFFTLISS
ncbi:unnamed protein product [Euphydryas editha]|uniref:Odorant receptor n=1 Tax=Euphydryas editha TaxID=104508 RepID=A0AAU9TGM1_EUPED|nr:unnamed protein product [Euphydryas editha]